MSWARITKYLLTRLALASVIPAVPQALPRHPPPAALTVAQHCFTTQRSATCRFVSPTRPGQCASLTMRQRAA